jgi:hypothetical protein
MSRALPVCLSAAGDLMSRALPVCLSAAGDLMSRALPGSGRVYTAQLSVVLGMPLSMLLLKGLPAAAAAGLPQSRASAFGAVMFLMGLLITW